MSPTPAKMNPFPGLRPFTQEEDYLFFGREEQTIELLQRLGNNRFVAVVGSSGSGKSSLVRCGLLSELLGGRLLEAGAAWEIAVTHPGGNPLGLLTEALLDADLYDRDEENARENLLATLSRSHFGLVEAVKQADLGEGTNFLMVVDQFEEIFRFNEAGQRQQEAANEFVSLLLEAASQKEVPIYVVLTMRSDFIGECGQFEGLAERVNQGEFLIPRLTREQYKRVIEGPIKVAGGQIAPRLLQRLLNDLGQQADQLPCLQHALMRTWDVKSVAGEGGRVEGEEKGQTNPTASSTPATHHPSPSTPLDLDDYQRVGKMSQALSLHADEIYESLASDRERDLCKGIFQALTVEESNSRGIRRPQRLGRLCQILEVTPEELRPVIDAYRQSGVTFLMPSPEVELTEQTIIDISHESLMRVWTRLRQWVEEESQAAGIYHRLSESADLHEQGKAGLYRDPELGIALAWRETKRPNAAWAERYRTGFDTAIHFLEVSQQASVAEEQSREATRKRELEQAQQLAEAQQFRMEQQQRAASKLKKLVAGAAVVAMIAGLACVAALVARNQAGQLAQIAAQEAENARKNESRAETALAQVESQKADVETSLSKARMAEEIALAAEEEGRKLLYTTDMRLAPFVWRDDRTTVEQLRVLLARHIPESHRGGESPAVPRLESSSPETNGSAGTPSASSSLLVASPSVKSDLRGFEWRYYQHLMEHSATVFAGHPVPVIGAAFSAEQDQLVTLDQNGQLRRWDLGTQQEDETSRRGLVGGSSAQVRVLSPDGTRAALAAENKVHIFDTMTGQEVFHVNSTNSNLRRLIFSGDSSRFIIVDDKFRYLNAVTGKVIASSDEKIQLLNSWRLSADGRTLAVSANTGYVVSRIDETRQSVISQAQNLDGVPSLKACALSPDGQRIALGAGLSGALYLVETVSNRVLVRHPAAHASPISAIAFSPDGAKLATADSEGTIKVWEDSQKITTKNAAFLTLKGHQGTITTLSFSPDGKQLTSAGADRTVRVWELESAGTSIRPLDRSSNVYCLMVRYSPDGLLTATAGADEADSTVRLRDAATGRIVRELPASGSGQIQSLAFSPTDPRLLAVGYGGAADSSYISLWDIDAGTELTKLTGATDLANFPLNGITDAIGALVFSPDGKYLVAGFGSRRYFNNGAFPHPLKVWEVATRQQIRRLHGHTGACISLDFSKDGSMLASGSRDGSAILWSTETWEAAKTLQNPDREAESGEQSMVLDVAFAPDGRILALASQAGTVQLWDVASGNLLESLKGHSSTAQAVAFSPDGRTLASGSFDQTVRLWNVPTRRELLQLDLGNVELGLIFTLSFSPDGRQLLAGGKHGIAFWSTAPAIWNDPQRGAESLQVLLKSRADFQSRFRILSENFGLRNSLEMLDVDEPRVAAALAAAQANYHATRQAWPEAVAAYDRLKVVDAATPEGWLRTPGLLRLATALLHQQRPAEAAMLLQAGAKHETQDPAMRQVAGFGISFSTNSEENVGIQTVVPGSPAARAKLRSGDVIVKVNGVDTTSSTLQQISRMLAGDVGTKVRLTVHHPGQTTTQEVELVKANSLQDAVTAKLLATLQTTLDERLAMSPRDAGLLELHAELAGQKSDFTRQLADYTAAIEALAGQNGKDTVAQLQRLYAGRGNARVGLKQWQQAIDDYEHCVTDETTNESLQASLALARAEVLLAIDRWTVPKPIEAKAELGSTLSILPDDTILASGANSLNDSYRVVLTVGADINLVAVRLEALTHPSLPKNGPGRYPTGSFAQASWTVTAELSDQKAPIKLDFDNVWSDQKFEYPIMPYGHLNVFGGGEGRNCVAIWALSKPVSLVTGTKLTFEMKFKSAGENSENLGHFRLSISSDPMVIQQESRFWAATKLTDPWQKLAAAYRLQGDYQAIDQLIERRPQLAGQVGDLFVQEKDNDWTRAVEIYSRGITAETTDVELLSKRARAYEGLQNWDAAAADWTRDAAGNSAGAKLLGEFARRAAAANQLSLANSQFKKSQTLYEGALQADPENNVAAADLAQLLFDMATVKEQPDWLVLKPTQTQAEDTPELAVQDDGSIRITAGSMPESETIRWQTGPQPVRALRIESSAKTAPPANGAPLFSEYQIIAAGMSKAETEMLRGQFIRLDLPGDSKQFPRLPRDNDKKSINLAELQVFQGDRNIALRQSARQSSATYPANRAVDGNTVGNDPNQSYAHTGFEDNPWWEVDLGSEQAIDRIVVWNRSDVDFFSRMNHFRVRVLDHSRTVVLEQVVDKAPSPSTEIVPLALIAETKTVTSGNDLTLKLRFPRSVPNEAPPHFRVSSATHIIDLGSEDTRHEAVKLSDVTARLAAGYALNRQNEEALKYFAAALKQSKSYEVKKPIVELARRFDDLLPALVQQYQDDPQLQLATARSLAKQGRQHLAEKQLAKAQANLQKSRETYASFLTKFPEIHWKILSPTEMSSTGGATLTLQSDRSIFASGVDPAFDTYTIQAPVPDGGITALRLETIPDDRLPNKGASRSGEFLLREFEAALTSPSDRERKLIIKDGFADAAPRGPLSYAFDGNEASYWDTFLQSSEPHTAVFVLETPVTKEPENQSLIIRVKSGVKAWPRNNLGRFRLSVTSDPHPLELTRLYHEFKADEVIEVIVALAKVHLQRGQTDEAVAALTNAIPLAADRAKKASIIAKAAGLDGALVQLSERAADDRLFQAELAKHYELEGNSAMAQTVRAKARDLFEKELAREPENSVLAIELADFLLTDTTRWTVVKPTEMKSESGATLTVLDDHSILASGKNPLGDAYRIVTESELRLISVVRLEALTHESLPNRGPGRDEVRDPGNFDMVNLGVSHQNTAGQAVPIRLSRAVADYDYNALHATGSPMRWNVTGGVSRPHAAVFLVDNPVKLANGGTMEFRLQFSNSTDWPKQNLGRFRISVSDDPAAFDYESRRLAALKITDPWQKLAVAYQMIGDDRALDNLLARRPEAAIGIGDLCVTDKNWERAVAIYNRLITAETTDATLLAKRAEVYEKLKQWDLAIADWTRASQLQPYVAFQRFKTDGAASWRLNLTNGAAASMEVVDGTFIFTTTAVTGTDWHVAPSVFSLQFENGVEYVVRFKMKSPDLSHVRVQASIEQEDWHEIGLGETFVPTSEFQDYEFPFIAHDVDPGKNRFQLHLGAKPGKVMLKEFVVLKKLDAAQLQNAFDESIKRQSWNTAAEFALKLIQRNPKDTFKWLKAAPVLALADDPAIYSDFCERMVAQFADSNDVHVVERTIKAGLLRVNSIDLSKLPAEKLARMMDEGTVPDEFKPWGWGARAFWAYRSGDAESAVNYVEKSEEHKPADTLHATNLAVLAMARHQQKLPEEARQALDEASQVINRLKAYENNKADHDLLIAQILFREADALINGKPKP